MARRDPRDDTRQFALGSLVRRVHTLAPGALDGLLEEQRKSRTGPRLGQILIAAGILTEEGLEMLLRVQSELRSKKPHVRAMAMAKLAEATQKNVAALTEVVREEVKETRRQSSGNWPIVKEDIKKG